VSRKAYWSMARVQGSHELENLRHCSNVSGGFGGAPRKYIAYFRKEVKGWC